MSKGKRNEGFRWWRDWSVFWIFGGFFLSYFVYIPITGDKVHSLHWLFTGVGGVAGYGVGLFIDVGLPPIVRFVRHSSRKIALRQGKGRQAKRRG